MAERSEVFLFVANTPAHLPSQLRIAQALSNKVSKTYLLIQAGNAKNIMDSHSFPKILRENITHGSWRRTIRKFKTLDRKSFLEQGSLKKFIALLRILIINPQWRVIPIGSDSSEESERPADSNRPFLLGVSRNRTLKRKLTGYAVTVVYPEINFFYRHFPLYGQMKILNARQVIVPFSLVNETEWLKAMSAQQSKTNNSISNLIVDAFFPLWVREFEGKKIRIPLSFALSAGLNDYRTYNPWLPGASLDVQILSPDTFSYDYLIRAGYNPKQLKKAGTIHGRELVENRIESIRTLSEEPRPLRILVAIPPNELRHNDRDFSRFILEPLLMPILQFQKIEVIAAMHPRSSLSEKNTVSAFVKKITDTDTEIAISKSDIFVASSSATLRISESLGVPSINFDIYKFDYGDYEFANHVVTVSDQLNYEKELKQLIEKAPNLQFDEVLARNLLTYL